MTIGTTAAVTAHTFVAGADGHYRIDYQSLDGGRDKIWLGYMRAGEKITIPLTRRFIVKFRESHTI